MKRNLRRTTSVLAAASAVALASCSGGSGPSPATSLQLMYNAVQQAISVHYVETRTIASSTETATGDVSATAARVVLAIGSTLQIETRLVSNVAYYFSTNANSIQQSLGVSATEANALKGQWVAVQSTDTPYKQLLDAMSITSEASGALPVEGSALQYGPQRTFAKRAVYSLVQNASTSGVGYERVVLVEKHTNLPLASSLIAKNSKATESQQVVFRNWNQPVTVSAPDTSLEWSQLPAS